LSLFLSKPELREVLVQFGYDNVKRFSWKKTAREIVNVYQHLFAYEISETAEVEEE